jgi:hypothetical protein
MKPRWKFALVLLVGVGLLVLSFTVLSIGDASFVSSGIANPYAHVAPCNPGNASGCVVWPYIGLGLFIAGVITTLVGLIGITSQPESRT